MTVMVRQATTYDLETILEIRLESFFETEEWHYRYPKYQQFKKDHNTAARNRILGYLNDETGASGVVMLAELEIAGTVEIYVITWSVWKTHFSTIVSTPVVEVESPGLSSSRRDTNDSPVRAFKAACKKAQTAFVESKYGKEQLFLHNIGTRPAYRGQGGASALLEWGISASENERKSVALISNSSTISFYQRFGFEALASVEVCVEVEEEKLCITPMARHPAEVL